MSDFLGIDTSNYSTSAAIYRNNEVFQVKKLLPVKNGELGLRQSDAVFHHTVQLPQIIEELMFLTGGKPDIRAVTASTRPRNAEGSYMPCFLSGAGLGRSLASVCGVPFYETSHQAGHILAALYGADVLDWRKKQFIAFHVSGGTTDCLLCEPDKELIIKPTLRYTSLDLKAGQAVDRIGLMLGLKFPCGRELEKLAEKSDFKMKIKPVLKDGNCCLSGLENKCQAMHNSGADSRDVAKYCLDFIAETILAMTDKAVSENGGLPLIYAGGVMSNKLIKAKIISRYPDAKFAEPEFSCDNAVGAAIFGQISTEDLCRY